jgi:hypothetical protein
MSGNPHLTSCVFIHVLFCSPALFGSSALPSFFRIRRVEQKNNLKVLTRPAANVACIPYAAYAQPLQFWLVDTSLIA